MNKPSVILNVDDNEPARYARSRVLQTAGFEVIEAATGSETLGAVRSHHPDLVLLDVHLPDANGIEICRRLKASGESVIIIQISASATAAPHAISALNSGADAYLVEPVDPDVLVATVQAMLRLRKAERDLSKANRTLAQINRELRRSNEDLQHFAFIASHDLQEPVRTIIIYLQVLERDMGARLTEADQKHFRLVVDNAERMRSLIGDLLAYSQIGRNDNPRVPVDLGREAAWAIDNLGKQIEETNARIEIKGNLPVVQGEAGQLGRVLQNLLSNAIKYRKPGEPPCIVLDQEKAGAEWIIHVTDNGIGIAKEHYERVFAPFKRLHGTEIDGTGIGLALCRKIVENHGGRIWVESQPGQGSTFSFALPANEAPSEKEPA